MVLSLAVRLVYVGEYHELLWDAGVYAGMGKYLFSGGTAGLWEHIRPPLWPAFLGLLWVLKLDMILVGKIVQLALSLGCIVLVYLLGKKYFDERTGLIAAGMFSFSSIFLYLGFHLYTEIPALFLILLALYLFSKDRLFFAGIVAGLAFLAKFPAGMVIGVIGLALLVQKQIKKAVIAAVGFGIVAGTFLVANSVAYGSAVVPLLDARKTILSVLGCNVLHYQPWHQYLSWGLSDNILNIFAITGLFFMFKPWKKKYVLIVLALVIPLLYFMQLHCRDYRYVLFFLPFVAIIAAYGIAQLFKKQQLGLILALVIGISLAQGIGYYLATEPALPDAVQQEYVSYPVQGEIWTSNPLLAIYSDAQLNKLYYPVWNEQTAKAFNQQLVENNISMVFLDTCSGGIICPDEACEEEAKIMHAVLQERFTLAYNKTSGVCQYKIYQINV